MSETNDDLSAEPGRDLSPLRVALTTAAPFLLITMALLALAYWLLDPTPPRRVTMATGVPQGAYAEFGLRYAERLKKHGITVELRTTQGSAENLSLLRDAASGVDIAFVQGGAEDDGRRSGDTDLQSLGSMFQEPVWLFYRTDSAQRLLKQPRLDRLVQLAGWRVNIGASGSGVPALARRLLDANGIDAQAITLTQEPVTPAVAQLLEGQLDALVLASAPESLMVQMLLQTPGIELFNFAQAEAYTRRFGFLSAVTLPRGVVDLARDMPPEDVHMVAPTAALVARNSLHPALVQLFVQTAKEVHGGSGWFQRKGEFPNARGGERDLGPEAERFYRNGVPWLQRYLTFWMANMVDRMWLALLSIVAVLLPLSRVVPPLVELRIRSRVYRWYGQLRQIEASVASRPAKELLDGLDAIEDKVNTIKVPLSYADELYALKNNIQLVRRRVQAA
jgi:TRAP transporter TAXI family solute receptor